MDGKEHEECLTIQRRENRAYPRYPVDEDSVLLLVAHGMPVKARIVDLSFSGCRIHAYDRFSSIAGRAIEIAFKANGIDFRLSGMVQWSDGHNQLGIRFVNIISRRKAELAEVIEEMAAALRAKVAKLATDEQAALELTLAEISEAVAATPVELIVAEFSEPQSTVIASEPAVAPPPANAEIATEPAPPACQPTTPRDRRVQTRHKVDTFATILLVNVGSALRGRILDLSLSGCRIRTDEQFPVGIYTRVETAFHLEGQSFRLGGVIQAIHNCNMVGIRFLDLSERKRQQILELVDEIERSQVALRNAEAAMAEKPHPEAGR
jgi:c-di-GMP-binding flagellar brake protein YcgR